MSSLVSLLPAGACGDARGWLASLPADTTPQQAWDLCPRGDWLLWLASHRGVDRKLVVLAACACARLVLHLVPAGEDRPRVAIEFAERWTRGEATLAEVSAAADAAGGHDAVYATASAATAYATAAAATTNAASADGAKAVTYAIYAGSASAAYATAAVARWRWRTADAVRTTIPEVP